MVVGVEIALLRVLVHLAAAIEDERINSMVAMIKTTLKSLLCFIISTCPRPLSARLT